MLYSTVNVEISLKVAFGDYLRARGYAVRWQDSGVVDPPTGGTATPGGPPKDTVSLVSDFPAEPTNIVRLTSDQKGPQTIVVPAFTLHALTLPARQGIRGLGHADYEWERHVRLDGFAADEFQHRELADLIHDFFNDVGEKEFEISGYDQNAAAPPDVGPLRVRLAAVQRPVKQEWPQQVRYYVTATAVLYYIA